ncbi:hypothetical protein F4679DRAFT_579296 [Xylaria curta]|nr:hypothetical protein F4679DRAFT_579296 [Xylaria curta]
MYRQPSVLETIRRGPVTLVSVTYGTDGQLHPNIISGPEPALLCLPEEGFYILYQNRGLQIASACDQRKCYMAQVCRCMEQQHAVHKHMTTIAMSTGTEEQSAKHLAKRLIQDSALAWLNFHEVADEIRSLKLCFLAHPRTLSWDSPFGNFAFYFDSELEEHYAWAHNYRCAPPSINRGGKECSQGLLGFIGNAWQEFLNRGDYGFKNAAAFQELEDAEYTEEDEDHAYNGDVDDLSEWDDADSPIRTQSHDCTPSTAPAINHRKRSRQEDDFDFIDDLIDEEFPQLKKPMLEPQQATEQPRRASLGRPEKIQKTSKAAESDITSGITKMNNGGSRRKSMTAVNIPHEDRPAPIIIPPKNMLIARGFADCSFGEQFSFRQPMGVNLSVASLC